MQFDSLRLAKSLLFRVALRRRKNCSPTRPRAEKRPQLLCGAQWRGTQRQHAARRYRADGYAGGSQAPIQQQLHDEAAKRVPNQYRRFGLTLDNRLVAFHDFRDTHLAQPRVGTCQLIANRTVLERPGGRQRALAPIRKVRYEISPAEGSYPRAVDENDCIHYLGPRLLAAIQPYARGFKPPLLQARRGCTLAPGPTRPSRVG